MGASAWGEGTPIGQMNATPRVLETLHCLPASMNTHKHVDTPFVTDTHAYT